MDPSGSTNLAITPDSDVVCSPRDKRTNALLYDDFAAGEIGVIVNEHYHPTILHLQNSAVGPAESDPDDDIKDTAASKSRRSYTQRFKDKIRRSIKRIKRPKSQKRGEEGGEQPIAESPLEIDEED